MSVNRAKVCMGLALPSSIALTVILLRLGVDKFYYILAGGKKFATFPDLSTQISVGGLYLLLSILYLVWLWDWLYGAASLPATQVITQVTRQRFRTVLQQTAPFLALAFIAYPLGNDVYLYLHSGLSNLSQINPFTVRAADFLSELSPYVDWGQTSTYGPVAQLLFTISATFIPAHPIAAIYVYKLFCLLLHGLNGYCLWRWLPIAQRQKVSMAYLLHPILLMEQVSSGHIDILVSTSLILFALSFAKRQYVSALAALWLGLLGKTLPVLWTPLIILALLRKRRWRALAAWLGLSFIVVTVLSYTALPSVAAWASLANPGVTGQYQSSLHAMVRSFLGYVPIFTPIQLTSDQLRESLNLITRVTLLGFLGFYAWRLWRSDRYWNTRPQTLLEEMAWVTLVLMLFATPWLMPWYCSILLTFAALLPRSRLFGLTSLAFGLSSSAQYLLIGSGFKTVVSIGLPCGVLGVGGFLLSRRWFSADRVKPSASAHFEIEDLAPSLPAMPNSSIAKE